MAMLTDRDQLPTGSSTGGLQFDIATISDLVDPSKWSDEMDHLLISYLMTLAESGNGKRSAASSGSVWKVTADQVCDNFRPLQQQLTRLAMDNHSLSHKWGISGPKRKAVLARLGLLRMFNQLLEMYLPFLISDSANCSFLPDSKASDTDDFMPLQVSLPTVKHSTIAQDIAVQHSIVRRSVITAGPVISFSWDPIGLQSRKPSTNYNSQELYIGPLHAVRRRVFQHLKLAHFLEMLRTSATRPAKTEDDYDYPDDLAHVKVNRIKAFRAREAAELLHIPVTCNSDHN
jgi:hypothetical protein